MLLVSCDQFSSGPAVSESEDFNAAIDHEVPASLSEPPGEATQDFVTANPKKLAEALRTVGNENEVNVALRSEGAPSIAPKVLKEMGDGSVVAGVPKGKGNAERRTKPGFASNGREAYRGLLTSLEARGVEPYRADPEADLMSLRIPDDKLVSVLATLLHHPNVDYVSANRRHRITIRSARDRGSEQRSSAVTKTGPTGSNSIDVKHSFHNVTQAWDYTRGSGAKVGILDSGFAYDQNANQYHQDGKLLSSTTGIKKMGFVDDYDGVENCSGGNKQPYGNCVSWDDQGHGTSMAGIVGANDNNRGAVGIMPEGLTVSMKIAQNCGITGGCSWYGNWTDDTYFLEDDDFYWALEWANQNSDIGVLSMSFSAESFGPDPHAELLEAYNQHDILLLSSTGNPSTSDDLDAPQSLSTVVEVGGLNADGSSYGKEDNEDISARNAGKTTEASSCSTSSFCEPSLDHYSGGTSTSTAIVAGIAGLVRAHEPSLSAQQVKNRLISTARGGRVDALAAVTNDQPLYAEINGPRTLNSTGTYTWTANVSGEDGAVNYTWEYKLDGSSTSWIQVSTQSSYSQTLYPYNTSDFRLRLTVTSGDESDTRETVINVNIAPSY